ncbi:MAG: GH32 C-terminal domain-containing protein [Clostridia bacterium]|nr:GH32 C-terminal domain-containing protein [Clostridia bacterium]
MGKRISAIAVLASFFVSCSAGVGEIPSITTVGDTVLTTPTSTTAEETEKVQMEKVIFVDTTFTGGDGTVDRPFASLDEAINACEGDSVIVLKTDVLFSGDVQLPQHSGSLTVSACHNGVDYGGKLVFANGTRLTLGGDTVLTDVDLELNGRAILTADFNSLTVSDSAVMTGKIGEVILIGGSNGGVDKNKDIHLDIRGGVYSEITCGSRYGKTKTLENDIFLTFGGNAEVDKLFVCSRGDGGYKCANAEVLINGGKINTFINGLQSREDRILGTYNLYVTDSFNAKESFKKPQGSSFGISGTSPTPWGVARDVLENCGEVNFYAEEENFGYLIFKLLCDTSSFDNVTKIFGRLDENAVAEEKLYEKVESINSVSADASGDTYRPVYHYSPQKYFLADPNGLVYNAATGEYHMYYQRHFGIIRDKLRSNWGHAVSTDLVHWTEKGITHSFGHTESGSSVVDAKNTSGLFGPEVPPEARIVSIFSIGSGGKETQHLAYSLDGGNTFKHYGAVIETSAYVTATVKAFRDPKVIWVEDEDAKNGGVWLMVIGGGRVQLFTSDDLINWTAASAAKDKKGGAIFSECPDLFPLQLDGDESKTKWVLSCAGVSYYVGSLEKDASGKYVFTAEQDKLYCNGTSEVKGVYATQSFFNDPLGRRILLNWMPDKSAPLVKRQKAWDGLMSLPYEVSLATVKGKMVLVQTPVEEVYSLFGDAVFSAENTTLSALDIPDIESNAYYVDLLLDMNDTSTATLEFRVGNREKTRVAYNKTTGTLFLYTSMSGELATDTAYTFTGGSYKASLYPDANGMVRLKIFVDTVSIEVFGGNGEAVISATVFPSPDSCGIRATGNAKVVLLDIYPAITD